MRKILQSLSVLPPLLGGEFVPRWQAVDRLRWRVTGAILIAITLVISAATTAKAQSIGSQKVCSAGSGILVNRADGTVWGWGYIGDGTFREGASQVLGLSNVARVAMGGNPYGGDEYGLAVKSDGSVWAWGANSSGQLGDGTQVSKQTPIQVPGLTNVVEVAAGNGHSVALKSDGTIWTWGGNASGQLGLGNTTAKNTPTQVSMFSIGSVVAVAAGGDATVAIEQDGTAWAWGDNSAGQLGQGSYTNATSPTPMAASADFVRVAVGLWCVLLVDSDGTVWSTGLGPWWQGSDVLVQQTLSNIVDITMGEAHALFLQNDGTVLAGGGGTYGVNGSPNIYFETPQAVPGLTGAVSVATGPRLSLAVTEDGQVYVWGINWAGELADGPYGIPRPRPNLLTGTGGVWDISPAPSRTAAVKLDGTVWAWGNNSSGGLGNGTTQYSEAPVMVTGLSDVVAIANGGSMMGALKADGSVWYWGQNNRLFVKVCGILSGIG